MPWATWKVSATASVNRMSTSPDGAVVPTAKVEKMPVPVVLRLPETSRVQAGAVVPMPTLELEVSKLSSPASMLRAVELPSARFQVVAMVEATVPPAKVKEAVGAVVPTAKVAKLPVPVDRVLPATLKVHAGVVVPIPTLELVVSKFKRPDSIFIAVVEEAKSQAMATSEVILVLPKVTLPAISKESSTITTPELAAERVRS